jgi:electron transfer flavoprotein alpha subunit
MAINQDVWVFSEKPALQAELIAGARWLAGQTGGTVAALVAGPWEEARSALARGADCVFWLGEQPPGSLLEDIVPTLAALIEARKPFGVLIGATVRGKAITGRLAARLDLTAMTDVKEFVFQNGEPQISHLIFGGGALRSEQPHSKPLLATVGSGIFSTTDSAPSAEGEIIEVPWVDPAWRAVLRERRPLPAADVDLNAAKKVVCAGRGLAQQEDLALINELARELGAEVACSRPLAEGLGWLPRERYIGVSGTSIHPDLYLGVGVSGQVQHTIGMSASRVVVAINKDKSAPIFEQADYGIVGDLYTLVPALIKALRGRKS